ncbi:MAG: AAA family ATPase [Chloroflexi bacterium]|nr:AAA family ATPase [Chloroflexota bacterium]
MADSIEAIIERRIVQGKLDDDVAIYVMEALDGTLDRLVDGESEDEGTERRQPAAEAAAPARAFLERVSVTAFRGVGPKADLKVVPGPGLTLVVGANGTGKSSFAEGLEFLLTGENSRWQGKAKEWQQGWRNLHGQEAPRLQAQFAVEGKVGPAVVSRQWRPEATDLDAHTFDTDTAGERRAGLAALRWETALETHRPFLSYSQLNEIVEKGPSARFDAMAAGLGLERLTDAREGLRQRRLDDERTLRAARERLGVLLGELETLDDERAKSVRLALSEEPWDLDAVYLVLEGGLDDYADRPLDLLRRLAAIEFPSAGQIEFHCEQLREMHAKLQTVKGRNWMRAQRLSDALKAALRVHAHDGEQPCPVCQAGNLDSQWKSAVVARLSSLGAEIAQAYEMHDELKLLLEGYAAFSSNAPDCLADAGRVGIDASDVIQAWRWWSEALQDDPGLSWVTSEDIEPGFPFYMASKFAELLGETPEDPEFSRLLAAHGIEWEDIQHWISELIEDHGGNWKDLKPKFFELMAAFEVKREDLEPDISEYMETKRFFLSNVGPTDDAMTLTDRGLLEIAGRLTERGAQVRAALEPLREQALAELDRRENLWRPLSRRLMEWLSSGRRGQQAANRLYVVRAAEGWLAGEEDDIRAERFRPIAERAQLNWQVLGRGSSVSLDDLELTGRANSRRLSLATSIDGQDGAALAVMSQGELNALSLSLFLARAALPESPFGFLMIDDPVQAMDPVKVEGLARVLAEAARERQVIVFTHDERLPATVRRLRIEHQVLAVRRRERSLVTCTPVENPVQQHLDGARAVLLTEGLAEKTRRRVIPVFCRQAIEAACIEAIRRSRAEAGRDQAETERDISRARTLNQKLILTLLDDVEGRHEDMQEALFQRFGMRARNVVAACNRGVHELLVDDLRVLIHDAENLAEWLRD